MSRQIPRPVIASTAPFAGTRAIQGIVHQIAAEVTEVELRAQIRSQLANGALLETAALSALEAHLLQIAPLGEARYKSINDAFVLASVSALLKL